MPAERLADVKSLQRLLSALQGIDACMLQRHTRYAAKRLAAPVTRPSTCDAIREYGARQNEHGILGKAIASIGSMNAAHERQSSRRNLFKARGYYQETTMILASTALERKCVRRVGENRGNPCPGSRSTETCLTFVYCPDLDQPTRISIMNDSSDVWSL